MGTGSHAQKLNWNRMGQTDPHPCVWDKFLLYLDMVCEHPAADSHLGQPTPSMQPSPAKLTQPRASLSSALLLRDTSTSDYSAPSPRLSSSLLTQEPH